MLLLFCFSLERFIELNEEAPPSTPPPAALDEAMLDDGFRDDDFFAGSELQSQGLRGQESSPSQRLLGLDGPVTPLKVELETYFKLPNLPSSNVDILAWWKTQEAVLPLLGEIARKYLYVCLHHQLHQKGCSQPQEILSPSSGAPWPQRTWS